MPEPTYEKISVLVNGEEVVLDPANLRFNEATLSAFLEHEGSWYDYFGRAMVNAEAESAMAKELAEVEYMIAFDAYKGEGSTEKRAEAQARIETGVREARARVMAADKTVKLLKQHLRSLDKVHENAISMGHNLRKELALLSPRIYGTRTDQQDDDARLAEVIRPRPEPGSRW